MIRKSLDTYDDRPTSMKRYLKYYGEHFNKKLCDFAVSKMTKESNGKQVPISPYSKEIVSNILMRFGIKLQNDQLYDSVFVANMCKADFLGSSIVDELHLAKYVKDVIDDDDAYDGIVFNRWYADMSYQGIAIDWSEML